MLPETEPDEAFAAAERFRQAIADIKLVWRPELRVTASFAAAAFSWKFATAERWHSVADQELYRAERDGRNRCYLHR